MLRFNLRHLVEGKRFKYSLVIIPEPFIDEKTYRIEGKKEGRQEVDIVFRGTYAECLFLFESICQKLIVAGNSVSEIQRATDYVKKHCLVNYTPVEVESVKVKYEE